MVVSKINSQVSYPEVKRIDSADIKREKVLYLIDLENDDITNIKLIIAIGGAKRQFESKGVIYFPVYLVKNNSKVTQIGVYEVSSSSLTDFTDKHGELDAEHAQGPLLYTYVTRDMLKSLRMDPKMMEEEEDGEEEEDSDDSEDGEDDVGLEYKKSADVEIPTYRKDIFVVIKGIPIPGELKEETKRDAQDLKLRYKKESKEVWVNTFMTNSNYYLVDNEGGGDCMFSAIRDSYAQLGQQTSVAKLRKKLADEATEELFLNYLEQYEMAMGSVVNDTEKIKELEVEWNKFKKRYAETLGRDEKKQLADAGTKIKNQRDMVINEKRVSQSIASEYKFMKKVKTLDSFKKIIQTCEFWGETWALSTIERILNVKFILLSQEAYKDKDLRNVLNCGQLNDLELEKRGKFEPEFYIMMEYSGYHYKLIGYKKKQIFGFRELPYDIKKMIVDKCMERDSGAFSLIPEFIRFKKELKGVEDESNKRFEELGESKIRNLYDDNIEFRFYSQSSTKKLPGKGSGEKIEPKELVREFAALAEIKDWRKKLDNSWIQEFVLDGHRWNSVEHFIQASKFKDTNKEFYLSFSLDYGTELSKDPELAKSAGGKTGKHKGELLRPKEIKPDENYDEFVASKNVIKALKAKFSTADDLKQVLVLTKRAKLVHSQKSKEPKPAEELMIVRAELK